MFDLQDKVLLAVKPPNERLQSQYLITLLGKGYVKVIWAARSSMTLEEMHGTLELGGTNFGWWGPTLKQWRKEVANANTLREQIAKWDGLTWREKARKE